MNQTKVIIIGAGAAGLMAARVLKEKGVDFIILESTERLGGRAQTLRGNPHIEYGPEYLHGETPITDELIEKYGLTYYDLKFDYHLFKNGQLTSIPDFWDRLCKVLGHMNLPGKDLTFANYLHKHDHHSEIDQELAKIFVEGFDAADLDVISSQALKEMKDQVCNPKTRKLRRLLHGYGELIENMSENLLSRIYFSHAVEQIEWKKNEVTVRGIIREESIPFEFHGNTVLDTVSVAVLKKQNISPTPSALRNFLNQVEIGQVVKIIGEFHPDFFHRFPDRAFPFVASPDLNYSAWWSSTPLHLPIITAWAGGARAKSLTAMKEDGRKDIYIKELALICSLPLEEVKCQIINLHHHNWTDDPSFLGAYSYPKVHSVKKAEIVSSFDETLFFAGEAFHEEMSGTVEGAFATGKKAAEQITTTLTHLDDEFKQVNF